MALLVLVFFFIRKSFLPSIILFRRQSLISVVEPLSLSSLSPPPPLYSQSSIFHHSSWKFIMCTLCGCMSVCVSFSFKNKCLIFTVHICVIVNGSNAAIVDREQASQLARAHIIHLKYAKYAHIFCQRDFRCL